MTVKIKQLKERPLLNPPAEVDGLGIRERDIKAMNDWLNMARQKKDGGHIGEMLFYMSGLGLEPEVKPEDIKMMDEVLEECQKDSSSFLLAYYMSGLGLNAVVKEKQGVIKWLQAERRSGKGWGIARFHYHLKMMDSPQKITDEDKKKMLEVLDESRRKNNGLAILGMHFYMKNLGLNLQGSVTLKDLGDIRKELEMDREQDNGIMIARIFYMLNDVFIPTGKIQKTGMMPPLKKFQK